MPKDKSHAPVYTPVLPAPTYLNLEEGRKALAGGPPTARSVGPTVVGGGPDLRSTPLK